MAMAENIQHHNLHNLHSLIDTQAHELIKRNFQLAYSPFSIISKEYKKELFRLIQMEELKKLLATEFTIMNHQITTLLQYFYLYNIFKARKGRRHHAHRNSYLEQQEIEDKDIQSLEKHLKELDTISKDTHHAYIEY